MKSCVPVVLLLAILVAGCPKKEPVDPLSAAAERAEVSLKGRSIPALIAALDVQDEAGSTHFFAIGKLAKKGKAAVPALKDALRHEKATIRAGAAKALATMRPVPTEAVAWLTPLLNDSSSYVRSQIAWALGEIVSKETASIAALETAVKGNDSELAKEAGIALKKIRGVRPRDNK